MQSISTRKTRIEAFFTTINPLLIECFGERKFTRYSKAFLRHYADSHKVVRFGVKRLATFLANHVWSTPEASLAVWLYEASQSAVNIYCEAKASDTLPFSAKQFQKELNIELNLIEFEEEKIKYLDKKIATLY